MGFYGDSKDFANIADSNDFANIENIYMEMEK